MDVFIGACCNIIRTSWDTEERKLSWRENGDRNVLSATKIDVLCTKSQRSVYELKTCLINFILKSFSVKYYSVFRYLEGNLLPEK